MPDRQTVTIRGARIIFRNFRGEETEFNRNGDRNFGVILPEHIAEAMAADGWNIKRLKPSEEEKEQGIEQGPPWLSVKLGYGKGSPPKINMVSSRGIRPITESTVELLDGVDIAVDPETGDPKVDLIISPYHYSIKSTQRSGISAYLKTMYVTIEEDELELEYAARMSGQAQEQ